MDVNWYMNWGFVKKTNVFSFNNDGYIGDVNMTSRHFWDQPYVSIYCTWGGDDVRTTESLRMEL